MQCEGVLVKDIVNFMIDEGSYSRKDYIDLYVSIQGHRRYKTLEILRDEQGIKAVCRYNILAPELIFVIDVVCRKGSKGCLKELVKNGKERNPDVKYISYDRGFKYPNKQRRVFKISELLKRS